MKRVTTSTTASGAFSICFVKALATAIAKVTATVTIRLFVCLLVCLFGFVCRVCGRSSLEGLFYPKRAILIDVTRVHARKQMSSDKHVQTTH